MGIGSIFCILIMFIRAKNNKVSVFQTYDFFLLIILIGIIFGRIGYFLFYQDNSAKLFSILKGQSILFSYTGVIIFLPLISTLFNIRQWKEYTDIIWPGIICAQAFGKIGCFFSGCCFGKACNLSWAIEHVDKISGKIILVHPVQLYESASVFTLCIFLLFKKTDFNNPGKISLMAISGYCLIRFFAEFFRADSIIYCSIFSLSQIIALCLALICMAYYVFLIKFN